MIPKKTLIAASLLGASLTPFAQLAPGAYTDETITETSFADPGGDADWTFDSCVFQNNAAASFTGSSADSAYHVLLKSSEMTFSQFNLRRGGDNSSTIFELAGTSEKRAKLTGTDNDWNFNLSASNVAGSSARNELRLSGYSDFSVNNFKIASDPGPLSGSAGVSISGAGNTFTSRKAAYVNFSNTDADLHLYFNISGEAAAKSSANFDGNLVVRGYGRGSVEMNMKGNAVMNFGAQFNFGENTDNGKASFTISGSGNEFYSNASGNNFLLGSDFTGGVLDFAVSGKNNKMEVSGVAWIGSQKAGSGRVNFTIQGSGHDIVFKSDVNFRAKNGNSAALLFKADGDGISTLNANALAMFDASLSIDLTDFVGDGSGSYSVALISAGNNWSALASRFVGGSSASAADVVMGANGVSWEIAYEQGALTLNYAYNPIPEPAEYAALFGALALAFAAYRRRA